MPQNRFDFNSFFSKWDKNEKKVFDDCENLKNGRFYYFEHTLAHIGFPPNWFKNPFTKKTVPANYHWIQIDDFSFGDIKVIWEVNRFHFVYSLVRAYWRTGNEEYAEVFWQLVENWRDQNPPQQGVNWKCGQEISFRLMAWCFGLYGFLDCQLTTADRVAHLSQMIAISGKRIEANLSYAISQHNNHGISEGMGLLTIGILFPEFSMAKRWQKIGQEILERQGLELIYDDGSFAQHSVNYHRLILHDYLWSICLGEKNGLSFNPELKKSVGKAGMFLYQIQDRESGQVPYYGQNDGTLILPLNNCDYQDFRPVIQAIHYLSTSTRCYPPGPWDEDLLWFFGPDALSAPIKPPARFDLRAEIGGYYTLRSSRSFMFTRSAYFMHRPGQADMLHLDLWWESQNIALDAGTYSYNALEPWDNPLAHTAYHNTVTVDDLDQMERVSKFLWLPWIQSQVNYHKESSGKKMTYWEGEHNGYQRMKSPVHYRRGILRLDNDYWIVLDKLDSHNSHSYRLHWLFLDVPYIWDCKKRSLVLQTKAGNYYIKMSMLKGIGEYSFVRADEQSPRGWRAPYYYYREPALSLDLTTINDKVFFWTLFGQENCAVTFNKNILKIEGKSWEALLKVQFDTDTPMIIYASLKGISEDKIEIF